MQDKRILPGFDEVSSHLDVCVRGRHTIQVIELHTWSQPRVPEPAITNGWLLGAYNTSLIINVSVNTGKEFTVRWQTHLSILMQSPKTGTNSGSTWDIEGWALA